MADVYRVTIRLSPDLYAQLEARGSHGQSLAAIMREALAAYLGRQPEQPPTATDLATTLAALTARLDALQDHVDTLTARLEALAASQQPPAVTVQVRQPMTASPPGHAHPLRASRVSP